MTGAELSKHREKIVKISTGSKQFDALLGGGIQSMSITEGTSKVMTSWNSSARYWISVVFGEYRTGKTQLAHTLCVQVQLPAHMGGASSKAGKLQIEDCMIALSHFFNY